MLTRKLLEVMIVRNAAADYFWLRNNFEKTTNINRNPVTIQYSQWLSFKVTSSSCNAVCPFFLDGYLGKFWSIVSENIWILSGGSFEIECETENRSQIKWLWGLRRDKKSKRMPSFGCVRYKPQEQPKIVLQSKKIWRCGLHLIESVCLKMV